MQCWLTLKLNLGLWKSYLTTGEKIKVMLIIIDYHLLTIYYAPGSLHKLLSSFSTIIKESSLSLFHRWANWGPGGLVALFNSTQLASDPKAHSISIPHMPLIFVTVLLLHISAYGHILWKLTIGCDKQGNYLLTSAHMLSCSAVSLCSPVDYSRPGSPVHGISQARILEWVAICSSRGSSPPSDGTHISCIGRQILYSCATWEAPLLTRPFR